ncbi:MAG: deoxyribose-phosphate aldolase [candidate division Zixibacteria bacterium]|nr:deoxyribose-phosphate aldolase [candidate division Zixibacteria bacterium]
MSGDPLLSGLNRRIDHTLLKPEAGAKDIRRLCDEALQYHFHAVCVNPVWVRQASDWLTGSDVVVVAVAGFPIGANRTDIKVAEACASAEDGATEIDMVAQIGLLRDGQMAEVEADIRKVRRNLPEPVMLKVILEVGLLTAEQMGSGVECCVNAGAEYVKTSTGFFGPCTAVQVGWLSRCSAGRIGVKASGGIRTLEHARLMIEAGAGRLGTSAGVTIMQELARLGPAE